MKIKPLFKLIIYYVNGSFDQTDYESYIEVQKAYRNLSYSGNRIRRVEVDMFDGDTRAIWDINWTEASKQASLNH